MNFRTFFETEQKKLDAIRALIDGNGFIIFFKRDKDIFGATEEGRLVFARLKNPRDDDLPTGWGEDASFSVFNLTGLLNGEQPERVFGKPDLKTLKVIDREEAENRLSKINPKRGKSKTITVISKQDDESPNFIKATER